MKLLTKKQIEAIKAAINLNDLDEDYKNILIDLITDQGKTKEKEVSLYVDGAADLHSKTAGIGCSLLRKGQEIFTVAEPLIDKTNNEAEYLALIKGAQVAHELNIENINIYSDSELIVRQVNGEYKIKNDRMKNLHTQVMTELKLFSHWSLNHILREKNNRADALSKQGMYKAREAK